MFLYILALIGSLEVLLSFDRLVKYVVVKWVLFMLSMLYKFKFKFKLLLFFDLDISLLFAIFIRLE